MHAARARAAGVRAALALSLSLPALLLGWGGVARRWVGDDGFINLRVASQLLAGNGFVFNAGERSEAVTSPAWVGVLWLAGLFGARLDDAAWLCGLGSSVLGLLLAGAAALLELDPAERRERWFVPFGLLGYAALPPAWDYATSGLENGLGLAFLGGAACLVALATRPGGAPRFAAPAAAAVLGFAPLIRPDYGLLAAPLLGLVCLRAQGRRRRLALAGLGLGAGLGYQIFRMGYFASLVPNTALAKQALEMRWDQGLFYVWNGVGRYWLLVPLGALLLVLALRLAPDAGARRPGLSGKLSLPYCLCLGGLLHLAYVASMGGDFMHARLLLPGLFALFAAVPLLELRTPGRSWRRWLPLLLGALFYGWGGVCAARLRVPVENDGGVGDERGWHARTAGVAHPTRIEDYAQFPFHQNATRLAQYLKRHCRARARRGGQPGPCPRVLATRPDDGTLEDHKPWSLLFLAPAAAPYGVSAVVASRPLGMAGAVLGLGVNLVDYYGLADPIAARLTLPWRRRPGHEKTFDTAWQAARYATRGSTRDSRVVAARNALACEPLAELVRATREPLGVGRFLRNLRLAVVTAGLQIPYDHLEAEQTFCPAD